MSAVRNGAVRKGSVFLCVSAITFLLVLFLGSVLIEAEILNENVMNIIINLSGIISIAISRRTISWQKFKKSWAEYAIYSCIWLVLLCCGCMLCKGGSDIFLRIQGFVICSVLGFAFGTFVQFLRKGRGQGRRRKYRLYNS